MKCHIISMNKKWFNMNEINVLDMYEEDVTNVAKRKK